MESLRATGDEQHPMRLSPRELAVVGVLGLVLLAILPRIPFRPKAADVPADYRIPFALSNRYEIYQRFTTLASSQYSVLLLGDSVMWGQCAHQNQTLSHHLNALAGEKRFVNGGLDGMHPVALAELIEHHAPGIQNKTVLLHFDPLWLMSADAWPMSEEKILANRPGLLPRLAASFSGSVRKQVAAAVRKAWAKTPLRDWGEALADAQIDFLAWSLDHPYENPMKAISSALPPSEDRPGIHFDVWNARSTPVEDTPWLPLRDSPQWAAFERLIDLLQVRENRVLVLVGPMNVHMMSPAVRSGYDEILKQVESRLRGADVPYVIVPLLRSEHFGDICHPLGAGYEDLARELLRTQGTRLVGKEQPK